MLYIKYVTTLLYHPVLNNNNDDTWSHPMVPERYLWFFYGSEPLRQFIQFINIILAE